MNPVVLSELRLLSSTRFDSPWILGVSLTGDNRLVDRRDESPTPGPVAVA